MRDGEVGRRGGPAVGSAAVVGIYPLCVLNGVMANLEKEWTHRNQLPVEELWAFENDHTR